MTAIRRLRAYLPTGGLLIAGFGLLIVAGIWIYTFDRARTERIEATVNEFSKNANLALALDVHANELLKGIDHFLLLIKDQYQGPGASSPIPLARLVAPAFADTPSITFIGVANARGDVTESLQAFAPTNIADREFFQQHQRGDTRGLLISQPVLGRVSGRWAITLTRRLDRPDGSFAGIVAISIEPRYLTQLFEATNLGPSDVMSLVLANGITLARRRGATLEFGENIARSRLIAEHARQPIGNYVGPGGVDGQMRMFSYRTMTGYPVIATVGTLEADVMAPVVRRAQRNATVAGLTTMFMVVVSIAGVVMLRRQQLANQQVVEQASLLDKAQDAIIVSGIDRRISYWNKSAERLYGWTADETAGRVVTELFYPNGGSEEADAAYHAVMRTGEWTGELRPINKSGQAVIVESRFTLVRDQAGRPHRVLSINTDVTERRQLEQQFYRAQRLESIGTLAGGIAHDLNNILTPIMMSIELLKQRATDPDDRDVLATISAGTSRGAEMVRQVLSFARGMEGRRVDIDVASLIAEVERIARDTLPKTIDIRTAIAADLPPLLGDPTQFHQVLLNLCVNARDAMPSGGVLTMSATLVMLNGHDGAVGVDLPPGAYVLIMVQDTGPGIPEDLVDKIFDPFFTTKEPGKGTGLGLSTSLTIVKSHGGQVRATSDPGRGACFCLYLPASANASATSLIGEPAVRPQGVGQTILVVDDEAAIRMIAQRMLEASGYRVLVACDGAEAVAAFGANHRTIAAVVMDMTMPVLDGVAAIHAIARINPAVPIIAASGISANEQPARAAGTQVKLFLPKPFTSDTLLRALHQVIG